MDDRDLEKLARALGQGAGDRLDVERVAAGLVARLRADRERAAQPQRAWWTGPMVLRLAAALAVLAVGGAVARGRLHRSEPATAVVAVPALRDLTGDELIEVFDSLGVEAPVHEGLAAGLESLNEAQLKELLSLMEG